MIDLLDKRRYFDGRVIFDHLPKTAGQAINAWLTNELGSGCVTTNLIGEHRSLIRRFGGSHSLISGHLIFQGEGLDPRYGYITCFREPVDRAISWLYYVTKHKSGLTDLGNFWHEACRLLVSEGDDLGTEFTPSLANPYVAHFASIAGPIPLTDDAKLTAAIAAIDQYDVWGLYEDMPGFMTDVSALLGLGAPAALPRVNVTKARPRESEVSPKLLRRLQELNALDLELYRILYARWQRRKQPPVALLPNVSKWTPYNVQQERVFSAPEFTLLSVHMNAEGNVVPLQILPFTLEFYLETSVVELEIGIHILDEYHRTAFGTNTTLLNKKLFNVKQGTHRVQYYLVVDLPEGAYTAGFAFAVPLATGNRELAWFDKLVDFNVTIHRKQADVGYASMSAEVSYQQTSDAILDELKDGSGTVTVEAVLGSLACGEVVILPVVLQNTSTQVWAGTHLNPIVLSYHWFDADGTVRLFEGERTPLPSITVEPGKPLLVSMRVVAPATPGHYQLALLCVQKDLIWFDQLGFTPTVLDVPVVTMPKEWHYQGADARINTQCGRREGTVLAANGEEGFLLYGPYATLPAGRYEARLDLAVMSSLLGAWLDVVGLGGTAEYSRSHGVTVTPETHYIKLSFVLAEPCADVEVRFWVPSGAQVAVHALLISPLVNNLKGET